MNKYFFNKHDDIGFKHIINSYYFLINLCMILVYPYFKIKYNLNIRVKSI